MSPIPKHLRPRYRYLGIGVESYPSATITKRDVQRELWATARSLLGDVGSASTDLSVLRFDFADGIGEGIVRTRRDAIPGARATIACVATVDSVPIGIHVKGISGTVRACEEKYLGQGPISTTERQVVFEDASRTAIIRDYRVDVRMNNAFAGATDLDIE